ncbi:Zinc-finger double domain-containing protein [Cladophialophora immunda]|nr:Zinc-finger double domain-containing protein [Cladophialophora immunda]
MTDELSTAQPLPQPPQQPKRPDKTCEICGRSFSRNEHLVRHRRTHTSERPFDCPFCDTNFPRADVKDKHMKRFHTSQGLEDYRSKKARSSQRERSRLACDQCRRGKLKCDNHHPCQACRNKHLSCTVSSSSRGPGRPRNHEGPEQRLDQDGIPSENALDFFELLEGPTESMADFGPTFMTPSIPGRSTTTESCQPTVQPDGQGSLIPNIIGHTDSVEQINDAMQIPGDLTTTTIDAIFPPDDGMFFDGQESINSAFPDLDPMDGLWQLSSLGVSGWLDNLDDAVSGQAGNDLPKTASFNLESSKPSHIDQGVAIMVEFFQRRSRASSPTKDAKRSWYSLPPRLQMYDDEVINVLLNLGRAHVSTTFRIFSNFEATQETSQQLCLAMAAIGALFSTAEGSSTVAKSLYNDARRLQLEAELRHEPSSLAQALNSAKTSILLEMYGVCSGDKRSYEFWEAFHYNTMNGLKSCLRHAPTDSASFEAVHPQLLLVTESIYILDAYRVLLLLRPPCFLTPLDPNASYPDGIYESRKKSVTTLKSLMTPTGSISEGSSGIQHLAMISAYSWMPSLEGMTVSGDPNSGNRNSLRWRWNGGYLTKLRSRSGRIYPNRSFIT